ncbi:hypothetical protein RND81_01G211000 [Saponaria officinalis]|uniref:MICOS complex subunit Mic10 n=1 Tax=Saponaria officinalis TaxID=3572 RepID=A0AAW1N8Z0_SAPOF
MAENNNEKGTPKDYNFDAKWDACIDLSLRRVVYSTVAGAFSGILIFRSPVTRWASVAFGAGLGLGSAYSDCSRLFDKPTEDLRPAAVLESSVSPDAQE